jgi:hypothetical protein
MALEISDAFRKQYSDTLSLVVQQTVSKFSPHVTTKGGYSGEGVQPLKMVGTFDFETKAGRLAPTPTREPTYLGRWVLPTTKQAAPIVDRNDKLSLGFDPTSDLMKALKAGAMRAKDDVIVAAILATAKTGKDGGTDTPFPSSQVVSKDTGGTDTGLNRDKLIAAQELLLEGEVDLDAEKPVIAISPTQHSDLLKQLDVTSGTNLLKGTIVNGRVKEVHGFDVLVTNRLAAAASGVRGCPVWVPSAMHLAVWEDVMTRVDERADLSYAIQLYGEFVIGATRTEEVKVVKVNCYES